MCIRIFLVVLFKMSKIKKNRNLWKQPKCPVIKMDKCILVKSHKGLFTLENEWTTVECSDTNASLKHNVEWKKPQVSRDCVECDTIFVKLKPSKLN